MLPISITPVWPPTSAPPLTWQHWGAQRPPAASVPPPPGWWREASPLPPSGPELFSGLRSAPRSSSLWPCTLSHTRLLQSQPRAHTECQYFLCPFWLSFLLSPPLSPPPRLSLVENITGNPGEGDEPESFSQSHIRRKALARAMPRWQGDTDGRRDHLCSH